MYNVLISFSDFEDGGVYRKGQTYPRPGVTPTEERFAYLAGSDNKFGMPVIAPVGPPIDRIPCPHCDKTYVSEATLQAHIKDKHPEGE